MFDNLQTFFESTAGKGITIALLIVLFIGVLIAGKGKKTNITAMVASALLVALAIVLNRIVLFHMPQGGNVTVFGLLPIVLCAYFFGTRRAVMCGMCVGMIDLIFQPYVIHPVQLLLDYPLAYGAAGFAGLIFLLKKDAIIPAYIFGAFCRWFMAFLSGLIFFGEYAPEGFSAFTWSFWYNFTYVGAETAVTVALLLIPAVRNAIKSLRKSVSGEPS